MTISLASLNPSQLKATTGRRIKVPIRHSLQESADYNKQMTELENEQAEKLAALEAETAAAKTAIEDKKDITLSDLSTETDAIVSTGTAATDETKAGETRKPTELEYSGGGEGASAPSGTAMSNTVFGNTPFGLALEKAANRVAKMMLKLGPPPASKIATYAVRKSKDWADYEREFSSREALAEQDPSGKLGALSQRADTPSATRMAQSFRSPQAWSEVDATLSPVETAPTVSLANLSDAEPASNAGGGGGGGDGIGAGMGPGPGVGSQGAGAGLGGQGGLGAGLGTGGPGGLGLGAGLGPGAAGLGFGGERGGGAGGGGK
ncbi:MAG: hypothetical protein PVG49_13355 [Desulfobacteraceae bacterium]